jgi:hypothetical protein
MPASPPPTNSHSSIPNRPTLEQLLDQLRPGDTLVVWKLDRLGRSLRHLVDTVTGLAERGIGFRSLQEAIDTTTPGGKLVFHVLAALAEFERDLIRERTAALAEHGRAIRPATIQVALNELVAAELVTSTGEDGQQRWRALPTARDPLLEAVDLHGAHDFRHTFATWLRTPASPPGSSMR